MVDSDGNEHTDNHDALEYLCSDDEDEQEDYISEIDCPSMLTL